MKITDIDLEAENIEGINLKLVNATIADQYLARNITGLDADDLIPKFYGAGLYTKSKFYEFLMKPRDIVLRIGLNPQFRLNESYSDMRDDLYRAISSSRTGAITLTFNNNDVEMAKTSGFITKFETTHFNQKPEVQITLRCDDPMFRSIDSIIYDVDDLSATNPVLVPDNLSTSPHGFEMKVIFKAASNTFTIQDVETNPEWKFKIIPISAFAINDELYISSEVANKYLYMIRGGVTTYLMDRIEPGSIWPILFPGDNSFHIPELATINWGNVEFHSAYWGV
jgi:hypothetical protein